MEPTTPLKPRVVAGWRRRRSTFPWITAVVGAAILTASASPSGIREGVASFVVAWVLLVVSGFVGALLLPGLLSYFVKGGGDPEDVIDAIRVAQITMTLVVLVLWRSGLPTPLPSDPGDRSPF